MGGKWDPSPVAAGRPQVAEPMAVPTGCAGSGGADAGAENLCVPGDAFARRVCDSAHPDVALAMLAKGTPFTRMYLRGDIDAWNAEGGMSTRTRLLFDEEILVLRRRQPPTNGIVVGAGGGYQIMRWDGACYTLEGGEVTASRPPTTKYAPIPWTRLGPKTRDALLKSPKVHAVYDKRGKECQGATMGTVSKACEVADTALSATIIAELRGGLAVPVPEPLQ